MHNNDWTRRSLNSVWHPCTQMKSHETYPLLAIKRASGAYLYDHECKSYLDSISSWWTNLFGHANPHINKALKLQLDELEHVMLAGITHEPVVLLSEKLSALTNHQLGHAFYASDGASAVEIALKMSFHYWRNLGKNKTRFVCLENSYHGETLGALSVTDIPIFNTTYAALLGQPIIAPSPDSRQRESDEPEDDFVKAKLLALEGLFQAHDGQIASMIVEPMVQCATGMAMYPASYLTGVRELCNQYQILLIADEIAVGCGRTGKFFACEYAGMWPDLMTLSKGISGGYLPLSVVLASDTIYQSFYSDNIAHAFLHSHSFTGNPLACRAALATIELFEHQNYLDKNQELSKAIGAKFYWVHQDSNIENVRQLGTIFAFDVKTANPEFSKRFFANALKLGVLSRPIGNTVYLMPPYIVTQDDLSFLSHVIQTTISECI